MTGLPGRQFTLKLIAVTIMCAGYLTGRLGAQTPQWSYVSGSSGPIYYSGNVGIGTSTPKETLQVGPVFSIFSTGIDVALRYNSYWTGSTSNYLTSSNKASQIFIDTNGQHFWTSNTPGTAGNPVPDYAERLTITSAGSVGIGISSPQHLLHVAGTIGAEEVVVSPTGADYVFAPDYRLQPLSEVAEFVRQHRHLPEIPSAADAREKGVGLGEMQTKLLAKIEELTLHMIQAEERNNRLEQENQEIKDRLNQMEAH